MISVTRVSPSDPRFRRLMAELDEEQSALYPHGSSFLDTVEDLHRASACAVVASMGAFAVGCGAMKIMGDYAEIRIIYVLPDYRRGGVAAAMLARLEAEIVRAGVAMARLQISERQPEAISFYERSDFIRRGPFGDCHEDRQRVFLEKGLT